MVSRQRSQSSKFAAHTNKGNQIRGVVGQTYPDTPIKLQLAICTPGQTGVKIRFMSIAVFGRNNLNHL